MSALSLSGKVALVTGGSRGIGKGIALELARKGARVALTFVSPSSASKAEETVQEIEEIFKSSEHKLIAGPVNAIAIQADSGKLEANKVIVSKTLEGFKTDTIDILVNNAGVAGDEFLGEVTVEKYDYVMNVNVRGLIFLTQEVLPHFPKPSGGRIINVASISSQAGFFGQTVYAASKSAVDGLTRVWATELGRKYGITVNAINPGPVDTDMFDGTTKEFSDYVFSRYPPAVGDRKATAQDIADIVCFLAEERSRWVSGDIVCANGGGMYR